MISFPVCRLALVYSDSLLAYLWFVAFHLGFSLVLVSWVFCTREGFPVVIRFLPALSVPGPSRFCFVYLATFHMILYL